MLHRPAHPVADLIVIHRVGEHPLRGALKDGEVLDIVGDGRGDTGSRWRPRRSAQRAYR